MFSMGQDVRKESVYASFVEILDPWMNGCLCDVGWYFVRNGFDIKYKSRLLPSHDLLKC